MARTAAPADERRLDSILLKLTLSKLQYFSAELANLRLAVAELSGLSKSGLSGGVPNSVFIDADTVGPFERGFYAREYDGGGRPYRWTGEGDFVELRFFINRNIANRFNLTGYLPDNTAIGDVRAFVDYSPVPLDISYNGNEFVLSGELPPCPLETRAVLTLWSPERFTPAETTGDTRSLWFIFSELAVDPVEAAAPEEAAVAAPPIAAGLEEPAAAAVPGATAVFGMPIAARSEQPAAATAVVAASDDAAAVGEPLFDTGPELPASEGAVTLVGAVGGIMPMAAMADHDEIAPTTDDGVMPVAAEVATGVTVLPTEEGHAALRDAEPTGASKRASGESGNGRAATSRRRR